MRDVDKDVEEPTEFVNEEEEFGDLSESTCFLYSL